MDSLIPNMTTTQIPNIPGGIQPRALLGDLARPIAPLNPFAVASQPPTMFNPATSSMGLPQGGQRQSIGSLSAAIPVAPGADAATPMVPTGGPTPMQVLAEGVPKLIQNFAGEGQRTDVMDSARGAAKSFLDNGGGQSMPAQKMTGLGDVMEKIGGAAKSFFDNPRTNLASSSAVANPAGDMAYQTPFFRTQSSRTSGPVGGENANNTSPGLQLW